MKGKNTLKNTKKSTETSVKIPQNVICTDCEVRSCKGCGPYSQVTRKPKLTYSELSQKMTLERNIKVLKEILWFIIGFVASLVNFSRFAEFEEEQLYLETMLLSVVCYLTTVEVKNGIEALIGGLFHCFLAFKTKDKMLTVLVMTILQVKSYGIRQLQWLAMTSNVLQIYNAQYKEVPKADYLYSLLFPLPVPYIFYVKKAGVCFEDLFLCIISVLAGHYYLTGEIQNSHLPETLLNLIFWFILKWMRKITNYSGLSFKLL